MSEVTVEGISPAVLEALQRAADAQQRSLSEEIVSRLEQSLVPINPAQRLERIRSVREALCLPSQDPALIASALTEGQL
jgi:hypothetical protein